MLRDEELQTAVTRPFVEIAVCTGIARDRLEEVSGADVFAERLVSLLRIDARSGEVALRKPGRELVPPDRVDGRRAHVELATAAPCGPVEGVRCQLRLVERRHGHRLARHLRAAVAEPG